MYPLLMITIDDDDDGGNDDGGGGDGDLNCWEQTIGLSYPVLFSMSD